MDIKVTTIDINIQAIFPTLTIGVDIVYYYHLEAPISIAGILNTSDGKTIAFINEFQVNSQNSHELTIYNKQTKDKIFGSGDKYKYHYHAQLTALLSEKGIEHIENIREKDNEKSVKFYFNFILKYLEVPPDIQTIINIENPTPFIRLQVINCGSQFIIKQSDWVNKYAPILGIGNFLLLELSIPANFEVAAKWSELYDRLLFRLKEMQNAIRHGDWQKVMITARQFYENLKFDERHAEHKEFKDSLRELFIKDQHSQEGFENFYSGITDFFNYTSKFIHDKSNKTGQLNPVPILTKEDAYFAYALAIALLNVIGKKLSARVVVDR
jgi:hypothetical protein